MTTPEYPVIRVSSANGDSYHHHHNKQLHAAATCAPAHVKSVKICNEQSLESYDLERSFTFMQVRRLTMLTRITLTLQVHVPISISSGVSLGLQQAVCLLNGSTWYCMPSADRLDNYRGL